MAEQTTTGTDNKPKKTKTVLSMTPTTKKESPYIQKLELFGVNHHAHKEGEENHHKTIDELQEEVAEQLKVSTIGWHPLEHAHLVFLEFGEKDGIGLTFGLQENVFDIIHNNERLYIAIEVVNAFNEPLKKTCCGTQPQKDHDFDLTILGSDGGEIMCLSKTTPNEVFMTRGKENVGVIVQEDGLGKDEVPFNYVIHDEVGPLISVRRSPTSKVTDWGMVAYGGDKHIGKISNFWLHMPGGLGDPNTKGFGVEFGEGLRTHIKGYLIAMLFTIIFAKLSFELTNQ